MIANGENAMGGFGIGKEEADRLFSIGVQVITTGNHVWERPGSAELLAATHGSSGRPIIRQGRRVPARPSSRQAESPGPC